MLLKAPWVEQSAQSGLHAPSASASPECALTSTGAILGSVYCATRCLPPARYASVLKQSTEKNHTLPESH
eukprot:1175709-Prorocentrum_minimum.AAC.1